MLTSQTQIRAIFDHCVNREILVFINAVHFFQMQSNYEYSAKLTVGLFKYM